ncbi:hypothetical protein [Peribacillus acanthi]|uniref:hypothetical protein n=1 Tax=Peribacillus acanthi TaxID=2171554 RepID=UPI000D3E6A2F|nr:hypothetical protein [Peribacillus acanthi]
MSLAICVLITWIVIIILHAIPKKLSELDMVFLYFMNTIFEVSIFTILHINLNKLVVSHDVEKSFADLVIRLIMIPLVFVITANILLYSWKYLKWFIVIAIIFSFILMQKLLEWLEIIKTSQWNIGKTLLLFSCYALFSSLMAWMISRVDEKEVTKT